MCSTMVGGDWRLAVGNWQLVALGGGWRRLMVGNWWQLVVVGSWRLVTAGGWRQLVAVGGWRLVAIGGWWELAVGGWWSLGAVLNKKKIWFLRNRPGAPHLKAWAHHLIPPPPSMHSWEGPTSARAELRLCRFCPPAAQARTHVGDAQQSARQKHVCHGPSALRRARPHTKRERERGAHCSSPQASQNRNHSSALPLEYR